MSSVDDFAKKVDYILEEEFGHMRPRGNDYPDEASYLDSLGDHEESVRKFRQSILEAAQLLDLRPNAALELTRELERES